MVRTSTRVPAVRGSATIRRGGLDPVHSGMRMSMSTTSGRLASGQLDRLPPVGRLADHLEVGLGLDQHPEAGPHERLVVGDQRPGSRDDRGVLVG